MSVSNEGPYISWLNVWALSMSCLAHVYSQEVFHFLLNCPYLGSHLPAAILGLWKRNLEWVPSDWQHGFPFPFLVFPQDTGPKSKHAFSDALGFLIASPTSMPDCLSSPLRLFPPAAI